MRGHNIFAAMIAVCVLNTFAAVDVFGYANSGTRCLDAEITDIASKKPREHVEISQILPETDGSVRLVWGRSTSDPDYGLVAKAKHVLFMFVPDESVADFLTVQQDLKEVGGVRFFHSEMNSFQTTSSFHVDPSRPFHVYSSGYVCDPEKESKNGLIQWRQLSDDQGRPFTLSFSNSPARSIGIDLADLDAGIPQKVLLVVRVPSIDWINAANPIRVRSGSSIIAELTTVNEIRTLSQYVEKLQDGTYGEYIYHNSDGYFWVFSVAKSSVPGKVYSVSLPGIDLAGGTKPIVGTIFSSHWSKSLAKSFLVREQHNYSGNTAGLLTVSLLEGSWIDRGQSFFQSLSIEPTENKRTLQQVVGILLKSQRESRGFGERISFPREVDNESFAKGYAKLDFSLSFGEAKTECGESDARYYLEWNADIGLSSYGSNEIVEMPACEGHCENFAKSLGANPEFITFVTCDQLNNMSTRGLWVRSVADEEWASQFDSDVRSIAGKYTIKLHTANASGQLLRTVETGGYIDPRPLLSKPVVGYHWDPGPSPRTGPEKINAGWIGANSFALPIGNSQDLKFAKTSSIVSPFGLDAIWQVAGLNDNTGGKNSPTVTIDRREGLEFSFSINDPVSGPSIFDDKTEYQAVFALGNGGNPRFFAPVKYYPNHSINFVVVGGDAGTLSRDEMLKIAYGAKDFFEAKRNQYTEVLDFSSWNWGNIYFHKTGWRLDQRREMEIATLFNGTPKFMSTQSSARTKSLPYNFGLALGGSISNTLTPSQSSEAKRLLGNELISYDFSDPQVQQAFGFTRIDPLLWDRARNNIGMTTPDMLCYTHVNSEGLSCFSPVWVNQTAQALPEIAFAEFFPILYAGYGAYKIANGEIATGILAIAPAGLRGIAAVGGFGKPLVETVEHSATFRKALGPAASSMNEVGLVAKAAPSIPENDLLRLIRENGVRTEKELNSLAGPEVGWSFVIERKGKFNPATGLVDLSKSQKYELMDGSFSSLEAKATAVPAIRCPPKPGGRNSFKKFDLVESVDWERGELVFVDRKCYGCEGGTTSRLSKAELEFVLEALQYNAAGGKKFKVIYEFWDEKAKLAAQSTIDRLGANQFISTRLNHVDLP